MQKEQVKVKKRQMTDEEVLFFARIAQAGMTQEELGSPEKYVEVINHLSGKTITNISQVLGVVPCFIAAIEEEDAKQTYYNLGLCNGGI
jgi:enhancing lycopene biosynthesis protein 2